MELFQMVIFTLDKGEYGVDISCVQEIIRIPERITKIPNMPSYVEGMFSLRDKVVHVIDLKKRFRYECADRGVDSRLLILDLEDILLGIIVDDVSEVINIDRESMDQLCDEIAGISRSSISGICKINERLILVLDAGRLKSEIFKKTMSEMEEII